MCYYMLGDGPTRLRSLDAPKTLQKKLSLYSKRRSTLLAALLTDNLISKARVVDQVFHGELSEPRMILNSGGIFKIYTEVIKHGT